jgi:hypothetical protein
MQWRDGKLGLRLMRRAYCSIESGPALAFDPDLPETKKAPRISGRLSIASLPRLRAGELMLVGGTGFEPVTPAV